MKPAGPAAFAERLFSESELAAAMAGDKDVGIWGGANTVTQYLQAGLLDELQIHVIHILLGNFERQY